MALVAALVVAGVLLAWPRGGAATAGSEPGAGRTSLVAILRARRRGSVTAGWVAELAEVTAVALRAGVPLAGAVHVAARSPGVASAAPWLRDRVEVAASTGEGVAGVLAAPPPGVRPRVVDDLRLLGRAWRLSEETGAAASHTTAAAAAALRARSAARERREATLAGPRASMRVLTLLPAAGPVVGLVLGLSPTSLYATSAARLSALVGALLTLAGWWWARRLVGAAGRPGRTDGQA
ncbi:type II secretion system F family protein [Arthrobacter sp. NEB 688]|uniref:type II secretion system F family protein n=1 Tax=Arthrobacter sp. NEB 688 TaxID=904039 RepID=UPI0015636B04|nr:type II secretion system F family protein [Arthrobacter sp. NEB 688]QKE83618.1 hypothetical protein HL663_06485 [Arthrobacter sp. NEB 688]